MIRYVAALVGCLAVSTVALLQGEPRQAGKHASAPPAVAGEYRAVLDKYCVTCHNERLKTAGLLLDQADLTKPSEHADVWEKVHRKLREGSMPPPGLPRPPQAKLQEISSWLVKEIDTAAAAHPRPGRRTIHRLNRTEYVNVIRDVLALNMNGEAILPPDDTAYGFDNIADVLSTSPTLMERYLGAAQKISRLATNDVTLPDDPAVYTVSTFLRQDDRMGDDLPFGSRGGVAVKHRFSADGEYVLRVRLQQSYDNSLKGMRARSAIDVFIDGARVHQFNVGGSPEWYGAGTDAGLNVRVPVKAGERTVAVTFAKQGAYREAALEPMPALTSWANNSGGGETAIDRLLIDGPYSPSGSGDTPSRRAVFSCHPSGGDAEAPCVDRILKQLSTELYRRPTGARDLQVLKDFYTTGRDLGGFEEGIRTAIERMLVDPQFLFRFERQPADAKPGQPFRISDVDLASRLSFFLWSSAPDERLLSLASRGVLRQPAMLTREVRRMLADPKAAALVNSFAGQWLWLRNLSHIQPNAALFPEWEDTLRHSLRRETELLMESMLREDRPVQELLTADYTFLNQRLAAFYGIPDVYGSHFRRVAVADPRRRGILGHGSILAVTSHDDRTSPVKRGNWLLENIIGAPSPPPPPNIPALPDKDPNRKLATMRDRMAAHRQNPVCASCHSRIDPLGFALEVFDGIGKARTTDGGKPIETDGVLPNGSKFNDITGLRELLITPPDHFVETVTEKLMTYAVGRGVEYYDLPVIRKIVHDAKAGGFRWSTVVTGIVTSVPFQMMESAAAPATQSAKVTR